MVLTKAELAAERVEAIRNEFHFLNEQEIEAGLSIHDLTTRAECNRAMTLLGTDINKINNQISEARLLHAKGKKMLDADWLKRAQSAIRHKKQLIRTIRGRMEDMPAPAKPSKVVVVERRAIILDVIQEDIGTEAMKAYVETARQRRPDLFATPEGPVDNGENS